MGRKRYATVRGNPWSKNDTLADAVGRYLPENYKVTGTLTVDDGVNVGAVRVAGSDVAGWTLDGYVLPRLASGMYYGVEVEGCGCDLGEKRCQ